VLAETRPDAGRRVLSAAQIATVRAFLADLRTGWDQQPPRLRNEFLRLMLDRVVVNVDCDHVDATMTWRTGVQQQLWIERPLRRRSGKAPWTEAENIWLRAHYATAPRETLQKRFPHRTHMAIRKQAATLGLKRPQHGRSKPKGALWTEPENALLQAQAAGTISYTELCAQLAGRTWDAIETQRRVLGLTRQPQSIYYHVVSDAREMLSEEDTSRMGW
jgi:hypothetical protein